MTGVVVLCNNPLLPLPELWRAWDEHFNTHPGPFPTELFVTDATPTPSPSRQAVTKRDFDYPTGAAELHFLQANQSISFNFADFPEETVKRAALQGIMEMLTTAYRGKSGESPAAGFAAAVEKLNALASGNWPAEDTGPGRPRTALEAAIRARCQFTGKDPVKVSAVVATQSDEWKSAFVSEVKANPDTASLYAALWAPKRTATVDLNAAGV